VNKLYEGQINFPSFFSILSQKIKVNKSAENYEKWINFIENIFLKTHGKIRSKKWVMTYLISKPKTP
jgi:hypothetical protein